MKSTTKKAKLFSQIASILQSAENQALQAVNYAMVFAYYEIGRIIVEEEQQGQDRAKYGKKLIKELSSKLTLEFGRGFSQRNIGQMRQFYLIYRIPQTVSAESDNEEKHSFKNKQEYNNSLIFSTKSREGQQQIINEPETNKLYNRFKLSWSHYLLLMRINQDDERNFYEIEAFKIIGAFKLKHKFKSQTISKSILLPSYF